MLKSFNNILIRGPDFSGKTTLLNRIHKRIINNKDLNMKCNGYLHRDTKITTE